MGALVAPLASREGEAAGQGVRGARCGPRTGAQSRTKGGGCHRVNSALAAITSLAASKGKAPTPAQQGTGSCCRTLVRDQATSDGQCTA